MSVHVNSYTGTSTSGVCIVAEWVKFGNVSDLLSYQANQHSIKKNHIHLMPTFYNLALLARSRSVGAVSGCIDVDAASISAAHNAAPTKMTLVATHTQLSVANHLPVLVYVKKMDTMGIISSTVAVRPNLTESQQNNLTITAKAVLTQYTGRCFSPARLTFASWTTA